MNSIVILITLITFFKALSQFDVRRNSLIFCRTYYLTNKSFNLFNWKAYWKTLNDMSSIYEEIDNLMLKLLLI
jgi:hypothetical protein